MPWTVVEEDGRYCVYKVEGGEPVGETLGCHDTRDEAEDQLAALYVNEPTARAGILRRLWGAIQQAFGVERRIKDVTSWDGSPSRWPDTDSYCSACLIDVNAAAGRDEKAQSHCMLPVRGPDDGADTYVRQAVHAAAGGHGLSRVKRPEDVPAERWDAAVRAAANKLISIYHEMDEAPPDSLYKLAGKTPPEHREHVSLEQVLEAAMEVGGWLHDFYFDDGKPRVVLSLGGKLYQADVEVHNGTVRLGELVDMQVRERGGRSFHVMRQANGRWRWIARVCTSVLNRVGEIDARALFDDFIHKFDPDAPPALLLFHDDLLRMGEVDWIEREDNVLLASGLLNDSELASAFIDATENGRGKWGVSIGYDPAEPPELQELVPGVTVPVYRSGTLVEVSVLPERHAAAWYTTIQAMEVNDMRAEVRAAIEELFGDEEKAREFIESVDAVNREIAERGLITRETTEEEQQNIEEAEAGAEEEPAVSADELVRAVAEQVEASMLARLQEIEKRLAALEQSDEEKRARWAADLPARSRVEVTYRPREAGADNEKTRSLADLAAQTLAQFPDRGGVK